MSIVKHTTYNILGGVIPLVVTLVTLPRYLHVIGDARYGVLAIIWTLLGYFGLFDLGLGSAVTNRIAMLPAADIMGRREVFWTALVLNASLGILGAMCLWGGSLLAFGHFVRTPAAISTEISAALPWMSAAFPLLLTASVLSGALMGDGAFLHQNAVKIGEGVAIQIVPLVAAVMIRPTLPVVVIAVVIVRVIGTAIRFVLCVHRLDVGITPRPRWSLTRPLFVYGGWVTLTGIVSPLMDGLDRVIIGAVTSVTAVTQYTVPFSLTTRVTVLPGSLSSALFPRFASGSNEQGRMLMTRAVRGLAVILTPAVVMGIVVIGPFLAFWISPQFALRSTMVGELLLVGIWANSLAYVPFAFLQATGRPDLPARLHLFEVIPFFVVLWLSLRAWGAAGAAFAWALRATVDAGLMFYFAKSRRDLAYFLSIPAASLVVTAATAYFLPWHAAARWAVAATTTLVVLAWLWHYAADDVRELAANVLRVRKLRMS